MDPNKETELEMVEQIRTNLQHVQENIKSAAQRARRDPAGVRLVVVSKTHPTSVVRAAIAAGAHLFGENYAEQAVPKIEEIGKVSGIEWHMIGHVQSRKARAVARHFDLVHSLDSLKLARRLNNACAELGRVLPVLLEFNVGGEDSKSGWLAADPRDWTGLVPEIEAVLNLPQIQVRGLMAIPPYADAAEDSRPYFQMVKRLRDFLSDRFPGVGWQELSLGTSADYTVAVEEGATLVRVGQAILGPRPAKQPIANNPSEAL